MDPSWSENPRWCLATTLKERIAFLSEGRTDPDTFKPEVAERRFQRWCTEAPFTSEVIFAKRLEADGISLPKFQQILGESVETLSARFKLSASWFTDFVAAFSQPVGPQLPNPESLRHSKLTPLLRIVQPIISHALTRLSQIQISSSKGSDLPFDPRTVESVLYPSLPPRLLSMLCRTAALELNVARLNGQLHGDSAAERYESFVEQLSSPAEALAMLSEYPVLARLLMQEATRWVQTNVELLGRLCQDWPLIQSSIFDGTDPGRLVALDAGAGDRHNDGRSVMIATFSSGFKMVYKPRSLAVDIHFQELLSWLNQRGASPEFRTLRILDRGGYAWTEFVVPGGCASHDEVWRFYQRQGSFLAVLYVLGATDFHYENLIAAGEHPMLLDLEALFHPRIDRLDVTHADELARFAVYYSVLGIGLLPQRYFVSDRSAGIDFSGIGAQAGQVIPQPIPSWDGIGTDEMRLVRKSGIDRGGPNRPSIGGADVELSNYSEAIVSGFSGTYELMLCHRSDLLADDGPFKRFATDEIRVVLRNTHTYFVLLDESFHPDVLRNALDRDQLFDRLWTKVEHAPYLGQLVSEEQADLWKGDIPKFTARPGMTDIWSASGARIANVCSEPSLDLAMRRLSQLGSEDRERQIWIIRGSLASASPRSDFVRRTSFHATDIKEPVPKEEMLNLALRIGRRLDVLALRGEGDVSWIGMAMADERYSPLVPLGPDLYDGLPGVILFLAFLGNVTQEERFTELARAALKTLRRQLESSGKYFKSIGGFSGWGGVVYALGQLGALWNDSSPVREAESCIDSLLPFIGENGQLDIIGGAAGCIAALLGFYHLCGSDRAVTAARECGRKLLSCAQPAGTGVAWKSPVGEELLTGFSHGVAGIAWALLQLGAVTNEQSFRTTALEALSYERSLFSKQFQNWPDLRDIAIRESDHKIDKPKFVTAWCHGAPGIGLARIASLPYLDDREIRAEINTALSTTLEHGFGGNHSLCHGDLGNIELVLQASEKLSEPGWAEHLSQKTALIVDDMKHNGFACGVPLNIETPGLMTGLAGIGYGLLRLAEPKRVPCVLLLELLDHSAVRQATA